LIVIFPVLFSASNLERRSGYSKFKSSTDIPELLEKEDIWLSKNSLSATGVIWVEPNVTFAYNGATKRKIITTVNKRTIRIFFIVTPSLPKCVEKFFQK